MIPFQDTLVVWPFTLNKMLSVLCVIHHCETYKDYNTCILSIKITNGFKKGVYTVLYHSPNSSHKDFFECFENLLENVLLEENLNIIVGDFNINLLKKDSNTKKLKNLISVVGMKQFVKEPTRGFL